MKLFLSTMAAPTARLRCLSTSTKENPGVVRVIRFRRNSSKTPALVAGFSRCRGEVIFTMDGDLQDDPVEIPRFLEKLDEGYDLVSGWKYPRLDPFSKTFPSRVFNGLVSKLTGVHVHDMNCGFKAYRREIIEDSHLKLYGEFHDIDSYDGGSPELLMKNTDWLLIARILTPLS
jgi:glycosyltransferase involved in cell wall biosynthesis